MAADLQESKFAQIFDLFDVNGNSYVERADIDALARRLTTAFASAPAGKTQAVLDAYADFWDNLAAATDADHDGRITRDEFVAAFASVARGGADAFEAVIRPVPHAVFSLCDTDGDGMISAGEFKTFHAALGTGDSHASRSLAALDSDGDGVLSFDELMHAAKEFVLSKDPQSPGNWLFGGVEIR